MGKLSGRQLGRKRGAILVDNLEIANASVILDYSSGEETAMLAEFKLSLNVYLFELLHSPVRSLADVISFNKKFSAKERIDDFGQDLFFEAQKTNGFGEKEKGAVRNMKRLSRDGFEKLMKEQDLDALVTPDVVAVDDSAYPVYPVLAIGQYPAISVPAGFRKGVPYGICFGGLRGSEPKLIEIAYAFEQATKIRKPPPLSFSSS